MSAVTDEGTATAQSPTNDNFADFLAEFRQTLDSAAERLLGITEEESAAPRSEDKWSPKQIIGHLIDSASNNHGRFVRAQLSDELVFAGYEQEGWVRASDYQRRDWKELVQLWQLYNRHMAHLMSHVPAESRLKLRYKHNLHQIASENLREDEPVTLDWFMRDYVDHLEKHLQQILG